MAEFPEYIESQRSQSEWNRIERRLEASVVAWRVATGLALLIGMVIGVYMARWAFDV